MRVSYYAEANRVTIQVELNAEVESRLVAEAQAQGITVEKVAERFLEEAVGSRSAP